MRLTWAIACIGLMSIAGCKTPPDHGQQASIIQADGNPGTSTPGAALTAVLHFDPGSAVVPSREEAKLQAVAQYLARHPKADIVIIGWVDPAAPGGVVGDDALSRARVSAVHAALSRDGLPAETHVSRLVATPPDADAAGLRVSIVVTPAG